LEGEAVVLAESPRDPLSGSFVPWAVPTSDGGTIYYTAWTQEADLDELDVGDPGGVPVIRRVDSSGDDSLFRSGAYAPAAARDGRVAYVQDLDGVYLYSVPNPNQIRVVSADGASDEVWSEDKEARYVTVGWAGGTLLAYEIDEGEYVRTYAFDRPDKSRLLSDGGVVGAISPDGEWVLLVETGDPGKGSQFLVVRIADGETVGPIYLSTDDGPLNGTYQGDWTGDTIVIGPGAGNGVDTPYVLGYAVLHFDGEQLTVDRFVSMELVEDLVSLEYPRFTPSGDVWMRLTGSAGGAGFGYQDVICSEDAVSCQPVSELTPISETAAIVDNKSGGT
jgi:hypothetical protein